MRYESWISGRIRLRKGAPASTATGVVIAVAGVALSVMVMLLTLAVVAGFKQAIERKVMGFETAVAVQPAYDYHTGQTAEYIYGTDTLSSLLSDFAPGLSAVAEFRRHAVLKTDNDFLAVECIGRDPAHDSTFERGNIIEGHWPQYADTAARDSIVISSTMSDVLGVGVGDRLLSYFFVDGKIKVRRTPIAGIYRSYFGEYDKTVVYTSLPLLASLGGDGQATAIALEGIERGEIATLSKTLQRYLIDAYRDGRVAEVYPVTDVLHTGAIFFNWLDLLDTNVVVIFILMACVAAFTLISSLFIIILDRVSTIGILRSLGASRRSVSRIFVYTALRLVGVGMVLGNALALAIILAQHLWHFLPLDPEMYYLAYVPFSLGIWQWVSLNVGVLIAAWLVLILPAHLAARVDPAASMRYE